MRTTIKDLFILSWVLIVSCSQCDVYQQEEENLHLSNAFTTATTGSGIVRGKYEKVEGYDVLSFLGIPYAEPPIGEKRFRKPSPIKPWQDVIDATSYPPPCMQLNTVPVPWASTAAPSENCLYLNIWIPYKQSDTLKFSNQKLPVMVWIYGGGFISGSIDVGIYNGAIIATHGNVIVVSMNYRLGVFGFLDADIPDAPGNVGLHDQTLALKWVKDNIRNFGGDPDNIALFGQSAGSVSVGLHMVSPESKGLFNRAIMQSGGIYHPVFGLNETVHKFKGSQFASAARCADEKTNLFTDPGAVVKCLKSKDALELATLESKFKDRAVIYFNPTSGNDFLPIPPIEILDSGDLQNVPLLIGNTKDEGSIFLMRIHPEIFGLKSVAHLTRDTAKKLIDEIFKISGMPIDDVADFYLNNITEDDQESMIKAIYNSIGDFLFLCPSILTAERVNSDAYYYMFAHTPSLTSLGPWAGVAHFDDVPFVFGSPIRHRQLYTHDEIAFSKDIIRKWSTFAQTGSPIGWSSDDEWPKYTKANPIYRELNLTSKETGMGPRTEFCNYWRKYMVQPSSKN